MFSKGRHAIFGINVVKLSGISYNIVTTCSLACALTVLEVKVIILSMIKIYYTCSDYESM